MVHEKEITWEKIVGKMVPWEKIVGKIVPWKKDLRKNGPLKKTFPEKWSLGKKSPEKCPEKMVLRHKNDRKFERLFSFYRLIRLHTKICSTFTSRSYMH